MAYRYESVQALRLLAALLVVVTHSTLYAHDRLSPDFAVWGFGTVGVDFFFVISGFVMMVSSGRHLRDRGYWRIFATRRVIRIVPMYWIATTVKLVTLLVLPGAVLHAVLQPGQVAMSFFFLPSRNVDGNLEPLLGVGWTLLFEMAFYVMFTAALAVRANVMWFCAGMLSLMALGSLFVDHGSGIAATFYLDPIVLYFLVGMIIADWTIAKSRRRTAGWLAYVVLVWVIIDFVNEPQGFDSAHFVRSCGVTALVLGTIIGEPILNRRVPRPVVFMGDASYSLYLFHPLLAPAVPVALKRVGIVNESLSVAVSVVGVVVAAGLLYWYVEKPLTSRLQGSVPYLRDRRPVTSMIPASAAPGTDDSKV